MKIMHPEIAKRIQSTRVIAVVVIDDLDHILPLAKALLKGGVDIIELTLRTPVAHEAGKLLKSEIPDMLLGFGTVLTIDQVHAVSEIGADFAVSPGYNPAIVAEAKSCGLSFAPGIMTPSDIELALEQGCRLLKYFPAETSGGMAHLKSMAAPFDHLGLSFIPLGGVNQHNAPVYLESTLISAIGGSWIARRDLIQSKAWGRITDNATKITELINSEYRL